MAIESASFRQTGDSADAFEPNTVGLLGIIRILFRWSFVVAPLAALTVWLAFSQSEGIEPEHTAESSILLIGPSELLVEDIDSGEIIIEGLNPLQQLGGTLETVARVTVLSLLDISVADQLADEGFTSAYQIGAESRTPIIRFIATDVDPALATATVQRLTQLAFEDLERRQDELDAPETNRIGAQLISSGLSGGPDFAARDRMRLAIAAVGFTIAAASAFFLEGIAELWRRRKRRAAATEADIFRRGLPAGATPHHVDQVGTVDDLLHSHGATLTEVLHLVSGDEDFARETARAAFAAATASWPLPAKTDPITWLYADAMERASKNLPQNPLPSHARNDDLWTAVHELSIQPRSVLALVHIAGLADRQIAQVLGIDETAVAEHRRDASDHIAGSPDESRRTSTESAPDAEDDPKAKTTKAKTTKAKTTAEDDPKATEPKRTKAKATESKNTADKTANTSEAKATETKNTADKTANTSEPKVTDATGADSATKDADTEVTEATGADSATKDADTEVTEATGADSATKDADTEVTEATGADSATKDADTEVTEATGADSATKDADTEVTEATGADSATKDADTEVTEATGAKATESKNTADKTANTSEAKATETKNTADKTANTSEPKVTDATGADSATKDADTKATEARATESKNTADKTANTSEAKATESKNTADETANTSEPKVTDATGADSATKDADTKVTEATEADSATKDADTKVTEATGADSATKDADTKATGGENAAESGNRGGSKSKRSRKAPTGAGKPTTRRPTKR